jgi:hypothetical protein
MRTNSSTLKISDKTRIRVMARIDGRSGRGFKPRRRDFTPATVKRARIFNALSKALVWTTISR